MPSKNDAAFKQAIEEFLDKVSADILRVSQHNLEHNGSVDTGQLFNSGRVEKADFGDVFERRVIYDAPQSEWIEYGTQPHPVSEEGRKKIAAWCKRKLGKSEAEAESMSWAIINRIKWEGTPHRPFLRPAFDEILTQVGFL